MPTLHFIAGLPRSGSTLLVALLRQNPRFAARISSPLCYLFGSTIAAMSGEAFLAAYRPGSGDCLLIDAYLPGMDGIALLKKLRDAGHRLPAIIITGNSDVAMVVRAMKAGAADFIEKPVGADELLGSIRRALDLSQDAGKVVAWQAAAAAHLAALTPRQRQIMQLVLAGHPSKNIAADLAISQRTVENHRASIMKKTGAASLPALARLALAAAWTGDVERDAQQTAGRGW